MKRYYVSLVYCNKSGCGIASLENAFEDLESAKRQYEEYYDYANNEINGNPFSKFKKFEISLYSYKDGVFENIEKKTIGG